MGDISSIHFKKTNAIQTKHNDRTLPPSYLVKGSFESNRSHTEAQIFKESIINNAKEAYKRAIGQSFKSRAFEWSAVVNLDENHTMADLERLANFFSEKYGYQCYQIAIHRDEGHIDDNGDLKLNHHAHLEFITLDKTTGKNRQRELKPSTLRAMQSEVAEILGMKRGIDKRKSGTKRIEPRVYASLKERERKKRLKEQEKEISNKERKAIYSKFRQEMIEFNNALKQELSLNRNNKLEITDEDINDLQLFTRDDYLALNGLCHSDNLKTKEEIQEACKNFIENRASEIFKSALTGMNNLGQKKEIERLKENLVLEKQRLAQIEQETAQKQQNSSQVIANLENELKTLKTQNKEIFETFQAKNRQISQELEEVKTENQELKKENNRFKWALGIYHNFLVWLGIKPKDWKIDSISKGMEEVSKEYSNIEIPEFQKQVRDLFYSNFEKSKSIKEGLEQSQTNTIQSENQQRKTIDRSRGR